MRAEIVGAGLVGLTISTRLAQLGWSVRVHEADAVLRATGGSIYVLEKGRLALKQLGVFDRFLERAWFPKSFETRTDGEPGLYEVNTGQFASMLRRDLHEILLGAARAAGVVIQTGSRAISASPDGILMMENGERLEADFVIGADGVRSKIAPSLGLSHASRRFDEGIVRVVFDRGVLKGPQWEGAIDFWVYEGRRLRVLYSPCGAHSGYLACMAPLDDREALRMPLNPGIWATAFPDLAPAFHSLPEEGRQDRYGSIRLHRWSSGRVAIVGDAAHAMPSSMGQGANMGMWAAISMVPHLSMKPTLADALDHWEANIRPQVDEIQLEAEKLVLTRALSKGRPKAEPSFIPGDESHHVPQHADARKGRSNAQLSE